jgi:antagonist of KipI
MKILKPGILSTIQDAGRIGYRASGIGPGGVMDAFAFAMLNLILDNEPNEAVLEMHFPAAELLFEEDAEFAITGGDFTATLNEASILCWKTFHAKPGDVLRFTALRKGYRVYFSVKGGFCTDRWLNSSSTNLLVQKAGYHGRALKKEDLLELKNKELKMPVLEEQASAALIEEIYGTSLIHCIEGPEFDRLTTDSKVRLLSSTFTIDIQANRMGYRLQKENLSLNEQKVELLSSAVCMGTVQLTPEGALIILMADHQTTGGYPRVLTVITADLPKLAQHKPGDQIRFRLVSTNEAEEKLSSFYKIIHPLSTDEKTD